MIFPLGFPRQYEFIIFKARIGHPSALEFLFTLGERCRGELTDTLCLPLDYVPAAMGLPPEVDPAVTRQALLDCGFIAPVEGNPDLYKVILFSENNAGLVQRWTAGKKGGRPRKKLASESTTPGKPGTFLPQADVDDRPDDYIPEYNPHEDELN